MNTSRNEWHGWFMFIDEHSEETGSCAYIALIIGTSKQVWLEHISFWSANDKTVLNFFNPCQNEP
uniref:Uncharacterized protein n=1 Tax=Solanum tuberosum TaxID=4113 RepID=M1CSW8_SOLTU